MKKKKKSRTSHWFILGLLALFLSLHTTGCSDDETDERQIVDDTENGDEVPPK